MSDKEIKIIEWTDERLQVAFGFLAGLQTRAAYYLACRTLCVAFGKEPMPGSDEQKFALDCENTIKCRLWATVLKGTEKRLRAHDYDREGLPLSYFERRLIDTWLETKYDPMPIEDFLRTLTALFHRRSSAKLSEYMDRKTAGSTATGTGFGLTPKTPVVEEE